MPVGEHAGGDRRARHPPLLKAGGDEQVRRGQRVGADVGQLVGRHAVLRRPAVRDVDDVEVLAREALERLEARGLRLVGAGQVALAADEQPRVVAVAVAGAASGSAAPARDEHPSGAAPAHARGDEIAARGLHAREEQPAVEQRVVRRDDRRRARVTVAPPGVRTRQGEPSSTPAHRACSRRRASRRRRPPRRGRARSARDRTGPGRRARPPARRRRAAARAIVMRTSRPGGARDVGLLRRRRRPAPRRRRTCRPSTRSQAQSISSSRTSASIRATAARLAARVGGRAVGAVQLVDLAELASPAAPRPWRS